MGGVVVNNQRIFDNMSLGVADRLWRVITPMGKHSRDVMNAAKTMAENMNVTDPRQLADIMEFIYLKRSVRYMNSLLFLFTINLIEISGFSKQY